MREEGPAITYLRLPQSLSRKISRLFGNGADDAAVIVHFLPLFDAYGTSAVGITCRKSIVRERIVRTVGPPGRPELATSCGDGAIRFGNTPGKGADFL